MKEKQTTVSAMTLGKLILEDRLLRLAMMFSNSSLNQLVSIHMSTMVLATRSPNSSKIPHP